MIGSNTSVWVKEMAVKNVENGDLGAENGQPAGDSRSISTGGPHGRAGGRGGPAGTDLLGSATAGPGNW